MRLQHFEALIDRINLGGAVLAGLALLLMMFIGGVDVITTNAFAAPVPAAYEITESLMVVAVFLAIALAQRRRAHIQVEIVVLALPKRLQVVAALLQALASLAFFLLIAWFGWHAAAHSFRVGEYSAGLIRFPIWPAKSMLAVGATMMSLQCLRDVLAVCFRGDKMESRALER